MYDNKFDILTVDEAAELLLTSKQTIYTLLHEKSLAGFFLKGSWKIPRQAIEEFIISNSGLKK